MQTTIKRWSLMALAAITFFSCDSDNSSSTPDDDTKPAEAVIVSAIINSDGDSGKGYIKAITSVESAKYDNVDATPTGFGATPILIGDHLYALPDYMGPSKSEIPMYMLNDKNKFVKKGALPIPGRANAANIVEASETKAYLTLQGLGLVYIFNPQTMTKTGQIDLNSYAHEGCSVSPGAMIIREGYLYVPLNQMDVNWSPTKNEVDIIVIDLETDEVYKEIKYTDTKLSFPSRPIVPTSICMDEKGDIYCVCIGSFGRNPNYPAGIIRIKKGSMEVDSSYEFVLPDTPIEGLEHTGTYVGSFLYHKGGVAYSGVVVNGLMTPEDNNMYTAHIEAFCEINLYDKTIKYIADVPLSSPQVMGIGEHDGQIVFPVSSVDKNAFYFYDPMTKEVQPNMIEVSGAPIAFYSLKK